MTETIQQYSANDFEKWKGPYFQVQKPHDWKVISTPEFQAVFIGPKIAGVHANITFQTTDDETTKTLFDFAENLRFTQSGKYEKYIMLSTHQRITYPLPNLLQLCRWYNEYSGNTIYQRQFLVRTGTHFHLVTTTQPAHNKFDIIDKLFDNVICSFLPHPNGHTASEKILQDGINPFHME